MAELYRLQDPAAEIRLDLDPALPEIHADRGRMRQMLANLITNGIEALAGVAARLRRDQHATTACRRGGLPL